MIKPYDEKILDCIDADADIEREIFENSEFERLVSEVIISINMWLNLTTMKWYQIELYLTLSKIQIFKTLTNQPDLDNQDKKVYLFFRWSFSILVKFLIAQSIQIPVLLQLINFLILKPFSPGKQKMH